MGVGNSQERYDPRAGRRSPASGYGAYGKKKRQRGLFRKIRPAPAPAPTSQPVIPIKYHSPHRHHYRLPPYVPHHLSGYPMVPQSLYPGYHLPLSYNNYGLSPYGLSNQPYMMPLQQISPMILSPPQPMAMPQLIPQTQPPPMPQHVSSPMYSPYMSSPYSTGVPMSYVQQQPQAAPYYGDVNYSAPVSTGISGPVGPYSSPYQAANAKLSTDWTGGGKISPGFLGPPI